MSEDSSATRHWSSRHLEVHPYTVASSTYIFTKDLSLSPIELWALAQRRERSAASYWPSRHLEVHPYTVVLSGYIPLFSCHPLFREMVLSQLFTIFANGIVPNRWHGIITKDQLIVSLNLQNFPQYYCWYQQCAGIEIYNLFFCILNFCILTGNVFEIPLPLLVKLTVAPLYIMRILFLIPSHFWMVMIIALQRVFFFIFSSSFLGNILKLLTSQFWIQNCYSSRLDANPG